MALDIVYINGKIFFNPEDWTSKQLFSDSIGDLNNLDTESKEIIGAINELNSKAVKTVNSVVPDLTGNVDIPTVTPEEKQKYNNTYNELFNTDGTSKKVDAVVGKGLSTEDFTTDLKTKLESRVLTGVNIDEKPLTPNNGVVTIETVTEKELTRTYLQEGISGTQFDAARHILGGDWRIPTPTDFNELLDNCDITIVLDDGEKGQRYTSRINGNSIFIKLGENYSGWTHFIIDGAIATNYTPKQKPAFSLQYGALPTKITNHNLFNTLRYDPAHIRPVSMTQGVDLGLPSGLHWSATNLSDNGLVTSDKDFGDKYSFGELTSKTTYTWDNYMCKAEECGTLKDPLAMEITDLGENEKLLSGTGLNLVRKRIYEMIGSLGLLNTTAKTNLVDAVNEVLKGVSGIIIDTSLDEHSTNAIANNVVAEALGNLYDLATEEKQSLVGAINEVNGKIIDIPRITEQQINLLRF